MNRNRFSPSRLVGFLSLPLALICAPASALAEQEQKLDMLQIGSQVYSNVTVTTKTKDYAFILHSGGMLNLKVADMSPEVRDQLGYENKKPRGTNTWTQQALAAVESPEVKQVEQQMTQALSRYAGPTAPQIKISPPVLLAALGIGLAAYLFSCLCFHLICKKAGHPGGILVWLPVLQMFPLLRAAGMSGWWFLAFFVPVLNLVAQILWCLRIAEARGKSVVWGIFLILPFTNLLALLYLAFSDAEGSSKEKKKSGRGPIQLMRLETA